MNLGNALLQKGKMADAMALFQQALAADPHDADARVNMGNALLQKGKWTRPPSDVSKGAGNRVPTMPMRA